MADDADTLKEFLVSIGFNVDESAFSKFDMALTSLTLKAVKLGTEVEAAAAAVVLGVAKIASSMEQLYFASQRTHSSVENIQAYSFAVAQLGGTAEGARASLENLGNFLRSSPAAASLIQSLGVSTSSNGRPRDETAIMGDLGQKFAAMPFWRAQAYASRLGIDQNTLIAMINGLGRLQEAYKQMYAAAGLDPTGGSAQAHAFMIQVRTLAAAFEILSIKAEAALSGAIGADLERFRLAIVANFGNITMVITGVAKAFIALAEIFSTVVITAFEVMDRLYATFRRLTPAQQQWIESIGGLILAWRAINLAFSLSPLGRIVALAAALLLLYNDYETWKAGGKSLIDWAKWEPDIEKAKAFLTWFGQIVVTIVNSVGGWKTVFDAFLTYFMATWSIAIIGRLATILGMIVSIGRGMMGISAGGAAGAAEGAAESTGVLAGLGAVIRGLFTGAMGAITLPMFLSGDTSDNPAAQIYGDGMGAYLLNEQTSAKSITGYDPITGKNITTPGYQDLNSVMAQNGPQASVAKDVRDYLVRTYGISPGAADGLVANMMAESGLNPTLYGDHGSAYGIGQWHSDRQAEFARLYGHSIIGSPLSEQLDFYMNEVMGHTRDTGSAQVGEMMGEPAFKAASEAQQAAAVGYAESAFGERPAGGTAVAIARAKQAQGYSKTFGPVAGSGPVVQQTNTTHITVPNTSTAASLAAHQGRINERNARNLQTAVNKAN